MQDLFLLNSDNRKTIEEALKQYVDQYEILAEHSHELIAIIDEKTRFRFTSPSFNKVLGYSPLELVDKSIFQFIDEREYYNLQGVLAQLSLNDHTEQMINVYDKSMKQILCKWTIKKIVNKDEGVIEYALTGRVVEALQMQISNSLPNKKFFQNTLEHTTDIVTVLDHEKHIYYVSPAIKKHLGYDTPDLIGLNAFDFIHPDDIDDVKIAFSEAEDKLGSVQVVEVRYRHKSGRWVAFEASGKGYLEDGELHFVVSSRDISLRKHFQWAFERKVKELDAFMYKIAHDMRAPVASIMGIVDMAKDDPDTKKRDLLLDMIDKSCKKVDDIVLGLVKISNILSKKVEKKELDIHEVIRGVLQENATAFKQSHIKVEVNEKFDGRVFADEALIKQMLESLVVNVVQFADHEKKDSFLSIVTTKKDKDNFCIQICDNGVGIREHALPKIFDIFFVGAKSSKGSGLGLYIVHNIIEKLGGQITVESEKGKGTCLQISLPININGSGQFFNISMAS